MIACDQFGHQEKRATRRTLSGALGYNHPRTDRKIAGCFCSRADQGDDRPLGIGQENGEIGASLGVVVPTGCVPMARHL